jgi:DNA polymerase IV
MADDVPILISSWPNAILHLDGDAFFASCEQAIHPELKGKPVITGKERNIVASMSYEAKALGIKRATAIWEAKQICPQAIILPSDYETYSLMSKKMFSVMKRFSPMVEEASIDEGFADLKGLRRLYHTNYVEIAKKIRETIEQELDLPISAGLSLTKTLAKLCTKFKKPRGFTWVRGRAIHEFLKQIPAGDVCGIGPNTTALLKKQGVYTAFDYVKRPERWAKQLLGKIGVELWRELRGDMVYTLNAEAKASYQSISKTKTFTPPSSDYHYVKAQLFRNAESAFIKLRRHRLRAKRIVIYLKTQDFKGSAMQADLNHATVSPIEAFPLIENLFQRIIVPHTLYRSTGAILSNIEDDNGLQFELFEDPVRMIHMRQLSKQIDEISAHYGKHTVHSGTGLYLGVNARKSRLENPRNTLPQRKADLLSGETFRQHLQIPLWQVKV